jgi:Skp family chaperone for outer membrane proteins
MIGDDELKEMQEQIQAMEKELAERKKELQSVKYQGLRAAMEARKEADEAVKMELKALGYNQAASFGQPFSWNWRL